jgi:exodeoxyribonuclease-3
MEKLVWWVERVRPDVLLLQETKLTDEDAPHDAFRTLGFEVAHHGQGRWNGVAIASRVGLEDVVLNFGEPRVPVATEGESDAAPLAEARMIAARCGKARVVSVYVPNGRSVESVFYRAKLVWLDRLWRWLAEAADPAEPLALGGDFNVAPANEDVWDPLLLRGGTHVSPLERVAFGRLLEWGLVDAYRRWHPEPGRYTWWDYRAGCFHKNQGMRIDHLLVTAPLLGRIVAAEIDRAARKGKPTPSDHAPLVIDVDEPGHPFDAGWARTNP